MWIRDCNPEDEALQAAVYNVAYSMKVSSAAPRAAPSPHPCPQQDILVIPEQERVLFQSHAGVAAGARAPEAEV